MRKLLSGVAIFAIATLTIQVTNVGAAASPRRVIPTNTAINGRVNALALGAGRLFIGGQMTAPFNRLGAINPGSGTVAWAPGGVPSEVRALELVGGTLFVGGAFGIRIYNASSLALLRSFSCGSVRALAVDSTGGGVIVGGNISQCDNQTHQNLARIDVGSRTVVAGFTASTNATVTALESDASGTFVGGFFANIRGTQASVATSRFRLGKITAGGAVVTSFAPTYVPASGEAGSGKSVRAFDTSNGRLFASWGESVNKVVVYNQTSAAFIRQWGSNGDTQAVFTQGGNAYFGGHWQTFNGSGPLYFAAVDAGSFAREAVVSPIPIAAMGIFAIIGDGGGGLWLEATSEATGDQEPSTSSVWSTSPRSGSCGHVRRVRGSSP